MDKTNNLQYFLTDIADTIREKEGSTDPINAQDFSKHIRAMATKSDVAALDCYYFASNAFNESGDPTFLYTLLLSMQDIQNAYPGIFPFSGCVKVTDSEMTTFIPAHTLLNMSGTSGETTSIAFPKYVYGSILGSGIEVTSTCTPIIEFFSQTLTEEEYIAFENAVQNQQITKEEFWNE